MCGIYGYIGYKNAYDEVFDGLKKLQYRGYDSCGIAYYDKEFKLTKAEGLLENLKQPEGQYNIAFGHTRWATNGKVCLQNTHPHVSYDGEFVVVHNGIINNYYELKTNLKNKGISFYSDTDTEVIANLLSSLQGNFDDRVRKLKDYLKGSYSLIIGCKNGSLYLVKNFSPLNILKTCSEIYISSDVSSLPSGKLYQLQDGDILKVKDSKIYNLSNSKLKFSNNKNTFKADDLGKFPHHMIKEIFETPNSIYNTYQYLSTQDVEPIFNNINQITFIGCGTAYHSCLIGQEYFKSLNRFGTDCFLASNYEVKKRIKKKHLHIIVSQSGETADCIKIAKQIKKFGGKLLIITNEGKSTITNFSDFVLLTKAKKELAVASTKTYSCQVFLFIYLYKILKGEKPYEIQNFVDDLTDYLNKIDVKSVANILKNKDKFILIAKDIDYSLILEASLKIREIDYIYTLPMYAGELKHGTLSLIDDESVVLALNTSENIDKLKTSIDEIKSRGGFVIECEKIFSIHTKFADFKPIYAIIPFQLLSYQIAILNNRNPDMPRNLAKSVTVE